ncbi:glycerol-3-phosphate dehydrogenase, partial [mine drainage metagenome]
WMLRTGLFLYDHIGERRRLAPTRTLRRGHAPALDPLRQPIRIAFEYSDCAVDDARLVVLNAIDAHERGACIAVGWNLVAGRREALLWHLETQSPRGERRSVQARALINAAGPWVQSVLSSVGVPWHRALRLVKGSHIVVPRPVCRGARLHAARVRRTCHFRNSLRRRIHPDQYHGRSLRDRSCAGRR